jgi:hypothetical protein
MGQNSNDGMKHQGDQDKRKQKISKPFYSKREMKNYYVDQPLS